MIRAVARPLLAESSRQWHHLLTKTSSSCMFQSDEKERFEVWVSVMDDALNEFKELLPGELAVKLDGSPESLQALEAWILQNYADYHAVKAERNTTLIDGVARYLGEVLRKRVGGIWDIRFGKPKDINNGIPLIVGYRGQQTPLAPHRLITACADRRTGDYFLTLLRNQAELGATR